jgi:hypothetical protein
VDAQEDIEMGKTVLETLNVLCEVDESEAKVTWLISVSRQDPEA